MTEENYTRMRAAIIARIYRHGEPLADGRPKFPRCLKADYAALERLENEYKNTENGGNS